MMQRKIVQEYIGKTNPISLYIDPTEPSKFYCGFLIDCDDYGFLASGLTPDGRWDGYLWESLSNIYRISHHGAYEKKMALLASSYQLFHFDIPSSDNLVVSLITYAIQQNKIVSITIENSGYDDAVGFPTWIDNTICRLNCITEYGEGDGETIIQLSEITAIACDSEAERIRNRLFLSKRH